MLGSAFPTDTSVATSPAGASRENAPFGRAWIFVTRDGRSVVESPIERISTNNPPLPRRSLTTGGGTPNRRQGSPSEFGRDPIDAGSEIAPGAICESPVFRGARVEHLGRYQSRYQEPFQN